MPTPPRVSVVMPVNNGQTYLTRSLDSIRKQTYRDLEIVVTDDGSTDDTVEILRAYEIKEPRLRVCYQGHEGLAGALNRCCRMARGNTWPVWMRMTLPTLNGSPRRLII